MSPRKARLTLLIGKLRELGLADVLCARRTVDLGQVQALAGAGIVSSCAIRPGESHWRLNLTRFGREVRDHIAPAKRTRRKRGTS